MTHTTTPLTDPSRRVAVVTGAARGIGRAVAVRLVAAGYAVVLTDVDGAAVRRTAEEVGAVAGHAQDVRDPASHARVAAEAARHGRLAVWVNNAGVGDDGTLRELTPESVDRLVSVNLLGVVHGLRAALDAFGVAGGDVVNVASLSGLGPVPGLSLYAATKAAVVSLTTSVAVEVPRGVRVHAVCPDGVDTPMVAAMRADGLAKALVHSGGGLLAADDVAREVVDLIGSRRVVSTLPRWRGGLVRVTALAPSVAMKGLPLFRLLGRRVMARR
jgi:NAD(P)-dependent dehydrogenase (short-subunit alcohol dehydrogenase family)